MIRSLGVTLVRAGRWLSGPAPAEQRGLGVDAFGGYLRDAAEGVDVGEIVTAGKALTLSAVWQAVSMISGDAARIPLQVFRRLKPRGREHDVDHPADFLIGPTGEPNPEMTGLELWRRTYFAALLYGRGWISIERDRQGQPIGLWPLMPDRTHYYRSRGRLWVISEIDGSLEAYDAADVICVEGPTLSETDCPSIIRIARHDLGLALAARGYGSAFFRNGATVGGILQAPPDAPPEVVTRYENLIDQKFRGRKNAYQVLTLFDGFKWIPTQSRPAESQLSELEESSVRSIARWFCLAPSRLGVRESVSYNSQESDKKSYFDQTLLHWLMSASTQSHRKLLSTQERRKRTHKVEHQVNALLFTDAKSLSEIFNRGIMNGSFNNDEYRDCLNMNPRSDGKGSVYYRPANLVAVNEDEEAKKTPAGDSVRQAADQQARDMAPVMLANAALRAARRLRTLGERGRPLDGETEAVTDYVRYEATLCRTLGLDVPTAEDLAARLVRDATSAAKHGDAATWDGYLAAVRQSLITPPLLPSEP